MSTPDPEFIDDVKQALSSLYDFAALQRMALAQEMAVTKARDSVTVGHHLRRELIESIEALSPAVGVDVETPDGRLHTLLQLHYIEGVTVREAGRRLSLSTRQVQRSLRRAEESVAAILWSRLQNGRRQAEEAESVLTLTSVAGEMAQLETNPARVDVVQLVRGAVTAVGPLAQTRGLALHTDLPDTAVWTVTDESIARQLLISTLSRVAQQATTATVRLDRSGRTPAVQIAHDGAVTLDELTERLGQRIRWRVVADAVQKQVSIWLPPLPQDDRPPVILVVDDNQGLIDLLERYLAGHNCRVLTAGNGEEALAHTADTIPTAIILDVMLPGMSGWDLLQLWRTRPETAAVPIIVCSVFNDPSLAEALGATRFLSKPIRRNQILDVLQELGVV